MKKPPSHAKSRFLERSGLLETCASPAFQAVARFCDEEVHQMSPGQSDVRRKQGERRDVLPLPVELGDPDDGPGYIWNFSERGIGCR